ncbi:MAG TPA: ATP-binding cassette domain-containing protein [Paenirhodobacter sp.]
MTATLRAQDVTCRQVGPVSLHLRAGECVALRGPSGVGKSTVLRALADLQPHGGQVWLDDIAMQAMPAPQWRRRVRYAAAEPGWWAPCLGDHFRDPAAQAAGLQRLGLPPAILDRLVEDVSSGERQRLALLRAIEDQPQFLLLDEPTSSLDPDTVARVEALLRDLLAGGMGILLVSHDGAQATRLADRIIMMGGQGG